MPPNLKGLEQAIELIDQAIDTQKKIVIVGDYDADGATSTALMVLALREMGADVEYLVPDRFKYGYGLTPAIADLAFVSFTPDVLITVDNGISESCWCRASTGAWYAGDHYRSSPDHKGNATSRSGGQSESIGLRISK